MNALSIRNLEKEYANGVKALSGVNLEVESGDFFGLIGPNGAGKTTLIGILTDLVIKSSGAVSICGRDIDTEFSRAKQYIGVVPQEFNFGMFEKVYDIVTNQAGYYGVSRRAAESSAAQYLKRLGLWEKRFEAARTLSGGMKRRLMIARGLVHDPQLLILDEPTAGVDVELRRGMWDFLVELNRAGKTVILTTHYLEEAEYLCNRIAIINRGSIVENTTKKKLIAKLDRQSFVFDLTEPATVRNDGSFLLRQIDETTVEVELTSSQTVNDIMHYFGKLGITVQSMRNKTNRLEETFLRIIEKDA